MNIDDFTKKISLQFLPEDQPNVTADIDYRKLSTWDSLTGMAILATIESEYGVSIPIEDFKQIKNINELFNYVNNQKINESNH
ncbi:MAG: acyl carrier protein [Bacteroidales bacterium]|nr:acyl carrier protein [Bacteroidales bacterium]